MFNASAAPASTSVDRICQFFLRGRCQRENCEFKHDKERLAELQAKAGQEAGNGGAAVSTAPPTAAKGATKPLVVASKSNADSDDESILRKGGDSDDESIGSGFTDMTRNVPKKAEADKTSMPPPAKVVPVSESAKSPAPVVAKKSVTPAPVEEPKTPKALTRRGGAATTPSTAEEGKKKVVRRDSKGFEKFDDYFSDSDKEESPTKDAEKTTDEASVESMDVSEEASPARPLRGKAAKTPVVAKKSVEKSETSKAKNQSEKDEETMENIASFLEEGDKATVAVPEKTKSGKKGGKADEKTNEEIVTMIFGEDGKETPKRPTRAQKGKEADKSVYEIEGEFPAEKKSTEPLATSTPHVAKKETGDGVTKIGNNTYFYTGANAEDGQGEESQEEDGTDMLAESAEGSQIVVVREDASAEGEEEEQDDYSFRDNEFDDLPKSRRGMGRSYTTGRKQHNTNYVYGARSSANKSRRCGECEGCNREDCMKCEPCIDKPRFGGKGTKKQACVYRICTWKNPQGAARLRESGPTPRGKGRGPKRTGDGTPKGTPVTPEVARSVINKNAAERAAKEAKPLEDPGKKRTRGRKSISVISPAPKDEDLPEFDPEKFKPGVTPPVVKQGDAEYHVIVSGVKDTGLCGKYWGDLGNLPPRRSRKSLTDKQLEEAKAAEEAAANSKKATAKSSPSPKAAKGSKRKQVEETEQEEEEEEEGEEEVEGEEVPAPPPAKRAARSTPKPPTAGTVAKPADDQQSTLSVMVTHNDMDKQKIVAAEDQERAAAAAHFSQVTAAPNKLPAPAVPAPTATTNLTPNANSTEQQNRSVSCVSDTNSQKEVVVECFAPYDDHRWVNIGKERDGMAPDAVQYARALRPPYHLLSFLRIKGYSTKGMSCTDKNTMVFVVLEGEITVVLHTTQFNAKKGDSFYIPPKNYYNLINQKAREAELSLIQFQYDGPLPTVSAASQSGNPKPAPASSPAPN